MVRIVLHVNTYYKRTEKPHECRSNMNCQLHHAFSIFRPLPHGLAYASPHPRVTLHTVHRWDSKREKFAPIEDSGLDHTDVALNYGSLGQLMLARLTAAFCTFRKSGVWYAGDV